MTTTTAYEEFIELTEATEGWFFRESAAAWDSLLSFQAQNKIRGHSLEIGVHHGKSAAMILRHSDPLQEMNFLVDLYLNRPKIEETLTRFRPVHNDTVSLLKLDSRVLARPQLMGEGRGKFRWIHIDGEHTSGAVMNDLEIASKLLAKNGVVVDDDFFSWWYPQITEAVFRYIRENPDQFGLFLFGYNKAYLAHPQFLHHYQDYVYKQLPNDLLQRGVKVSLSKTCTPAESPTFGMGPWMGQQYRGPDWDQHNIRY